MNTIRMNISVPVTVKTRMQNHETNWSAIATAAFINYMNYKEGKLELTIEERVARLESVFNLQ